MKSTYSDPEDMFHVEIFRSCFTILLHDLAKRQVEEVRVVRLHENPARHAPEIHTLSRCRIALLPAGICLKLDQVTHRSRNGENIH